MPAHCSTVHGIDTAKQPQGCGGPAGLERAGEAFGECGRRSQGYDVTALLLLWVQTPGSKHTALTPSRSSRRQHCGAADTAPTMHRCMSSPSLSRWDVTTAPKPRHKTTAARPHRPPLANRTTTQESDTPQTLTQGPPAARRRDATDAMPSWQKCCSPKAQKPKTPPLPAYQCRHGLQAPPGHRPRAVQSHTHIPRRGTPAARPRQTPPAAGVQASCPPSAALGPAAPCPPPAPPLAAAAAAATPEAPAALQ